MSTQNMIHGIQAGRLTLELTDNGHRLDELLAFASRLNPRRGYLFVSRVLGKHIPVRPTKMDAIHAELAESIRLLGDTAYVVGMAETAVGLGAGIARHLGDLHTHSVFHHTTRFLVPDPWIRIREAHSHADTMHMARLSSEAALAIEGTRDLVLVDDEISTGLTLAQLASTLLAQPELAHVKRLHIVSLVSWLTDAARSRLLAALPRHVDVDFVQLMAGTFDFSPDPTYQASLPGDVDTDFCDVLLTSSESPDTPRPLEREGLYGKILTATPLAPSREIELHRRLDPSRPHVVYGMGEFLDAPFRLALDLEKQGMDVLFQSSTRSPIALGDAVTSRLEHPAPGNNGKTHFLYNAPLRHTPLAFDGIGRPALSQALEAAHRRLAGQADGVMA
ncbi:phosphoribosyltransferase domain-containing protein [Modicisalibacter coralii]|uniref:phosphoribosyltransferase domain-containing protein n=1 Tax=Modicisalibacter coralii TaxID=2304602 RepID=UPI001396AA4E|nr:phosphoribosyltransferase domain-containing protein [Halomonas coralii]